jgi:exopolysaccharide biosynthesis polyprenyl glycosylphosphotransferase
VSLPESLSRQPALSVPSNVRRARPAVVAAGVPRRRRAEAWLPAADLLFAVALGALILRPWPVALAYCLVTVPVIGLIHGYSGVPIGGRQSLRSVARLMLAAIVCEWLAFRVADIAGEQVISSTRAVLLLAATAGAWSLTRSALGRLERRRPQRVVVVGSGVVTDRLMELIGNHTRGRMQILGYLDDSHEGAVHDALSHLGDVESLPEVIERLRVDRVVVAFSACHTDQSLLDALRACDHLGVQIDVVPRLFEYIGSSTDSYFLGSLPLLSVRARDRRRGSRASKRALDLVVSAALLVLTAPLTLTVALLIWLEDRAPILYRQERIGRGGKPFHVFKFRSMRRDADKLDSGTIRLLVEGEATIADAVASIKDTADPRITRIGRFIRKTSLDELPQLLNVLRGEMSLVGPRPLRAFEVEALSDWELMRQLERPGITGLWQVSGRSATSWGERMQLDYSYVRHWSLAEDVEILARTLPSVVSRDGAW